MVPFLSCTLWLSIRSFLCYPLILMHMNLRCKIFLFSYQGCNSLSRRCRLLDVVPLTDSSSKRFCHHTWWGSQALMPNNVSVRSVTVTSYGPFHLCRLYVAAPRHPPRHNRASFCEDSYSGVGERWQISVPGIYYGWQTTTQGWRNCRYQEKYWLYFSFLDELSLWLLAVHFET